jgi:hypothetical protein
MAKLVLKNITLRKGTSKLYYFRDNKTSVGQYLCVSNGMKRFAIKKGKLLRVRAFSRRILQLIGQQIILNKK